MPRLFLVFVLTLTTPCLQPASNDILYDIEEFNVAFQHFYHKLHGCPMNATVWTECKEGEGVWDRKLWKRLQDKAGVFEKDGK